MDPITVGVVCGCGGIAVGILIGYRWAKFGARSLVPFVVMMGAGLRAVGSPPEAVAAALADSRTLPADTAYYTRYLDLSHFPPDAQAQAAKVLAYHLNSLSRESDITLPRSLAGGSLLAFDLRDFAIAAATWEKLADVETREPYFHVVVEESQAYQYTAQPLPNTSYGQTYTPQQQTAYRKIRKSVAAPWLLKASVDELYKLTRSAVPVVRGDWFFFYTAIQKGRHVGYYDFLGLGKKEADFQRLIGANPAEARRLKLEMAASVARSGVAINNRGVIRLQSLTGGYWITADYKTSVDRQNTARLLAGDTEPPGGDASEQYGPLSNGLFAYGLFNANGDRQDVVPQDIALDHKANSNDRNIYAGTMSCTRCHIEGLRPIADFARELYRGPIQLKSPDYDRFKRLRQLYLTDLPGRQAEDNSRFAASVKTCNGLTVAENSKAVASLWEGYIDTPLTAGMLAAELGCTEQVLVAKAKEYVSKGGVIDPVIAAYAQTPPIPIRREHADENFAQFMKLVGP